MKWPGLLIALTGVFGAVVFGSGAASFVDVASILFVAFVGGGIMAAAHGLNSVLRVVAALFGRGDSSRHSEVRQAAETGRRGFVAAGWVGVIIGVIQTLSAMDDPSQLGRGMAVTLLTAFYGYLFAYLICLPVERSAVSD